MTRQMSLQQATNALIPARCKLALCDALGNCLYVTEPMARLLGKRAADLMGANLYDWVPPGDQDEFLRKHEALLDGTIDVASMRFPFRGRLYSMVAVKVPAERDDVLEIRMAHTARPARPTPQR